MHGQTKIKLTAVFVIKASYLIKKTALILKKFFNA